MHVLGAALWMLLHALDLRELLSARLLHLRVLLLLAYSLAHTVDSIVLHVHFWAPTVAKLERNVF